MSNQKQTESLITNKNDVEFTVKNNEIILRNRNLKITFALVIYTLLLMINLFAFYGNYIIFGNLVVLFSIAAQFLAAMHANWLLYYIYFRCKENFKNEIIAYAQFIVLMFIIFCNFAVYVEC